jgi:hypothetical protein
MKFLKKRSWPLLILSLSFLFSCKSNKTEEEQYQDMVTSLKYKTYKMASETSIPASIKVYKAGLKTESQPVNQKFLRLVLGYNWAVTQQPEFAFAEADIITAESKLGNEKFLAQLLRSIVMYENGWNTIAKKESDLAFQNVAKKDVPTIKNEVIVFHLIVGTAYLKQKDFASAKVQFAGFGAQTGINWPYQLCDAANDIDKGDVQTGLKKFKVMSDDPAVPEAVRTPLKEALTEIEKSTGDVNSSMFWPKAITSILFKQLKESANEEIQQMMKMVEGLEKVGM